MMKAKILIIAMLFTAIAGMSQATYYPLIDTGKTWHVMESFFPSPTLTYTYKCEGDTVINNEGYKILVHSYEEFPQSWSVTGFIREDTNRQVFYFPVSENYYQPALVYDFNAQAGDTLTITSFFQSYPIESEVVVTHIDSILIAGEYRRKIGFACESYDQNFWIEGVGGNNGLIETGVYCSIVCPTIELLCVQSQGDIIYQHDYYNTCYLVGTEDRDDGHNLIELFPNPASDKIFFVYGERFNLPAVFEILNSFGQVVVKQDIHHSEMVEINVDRLPAGIYFYILNRDSEFKQAGKLLIR